VRELDNRLSEDFIEEVRRQADIVHIISEHVVLKHTGKNFQGLCPFHSEKTPSFSVNPERQMFYCFGCHTGGNVFTFLMKKENLTFIESVRAVAEKTGLEFPEKEQSPEQKKNELKRNRFNEIHQLAANYFSDMLLYRPEGKAGLQYLEERGLDIETVKLFRLGYAPDKWDGLLKEMTDKGVAPEELAEFGLAIRKDNNEDVGVSYYDRFRGRIIFSIFDLRSLPVAFGGRVLDSSLPKYLNSPETTFFHKGRNLYGINFAYREIREAGYSLLLEGYMDTIAVHRAGFKNAVASLGTAFTRDQARILKRYASRVVICYDSDSAGVQASLRAGDILLDEGLRVDVIILEDAKDPDEFLSKHNAEEFRNKLKNPVTFIEFKYKNLVKANPSRSIPDKADIIRALAADILKIPGAVEREGYERYLSLELGLTLDAVQFEISSLAQKSKENRGYHEKIPQKQDISVKKRNTIRGNESDFSLKSFVPLGVFRAEQIILRIVLDNPDFKSLINGNLEKDFWRLEEHKFIFDNYPDKVLNIAENDSWYEQIQMRLAEIYEIEVDFDKAEILLRDCISSIQTTRNKESIEDLQAQMIKLEKSGDMAGALMVLQEIGERLKRGEK